MLQSDCFLAHDAMSDFFGVSTQHVATMAGPAALSELVFEKAAAALDGLPASVKIGSMKSFGHTGGPSVRQGGGSPESDRGEPSLGSVASIIRLYPLCAGLQAALFFQSASGGSRG